MSSSNESAQPLGFCERVNWCKLSIWAPLITCRRTDVLSQVGGQMFTLAGSLSGRLKRTTCHSLKAAFCHTPSHTYASPYMSRVSLHAGDETAVREHALAQYPLGINYLSLTSLSFQSLHTRTQQNKPTLRC